jgi:hypothetical protein
MPERLPRSGNASPAHAHPFQGEDKTAITEPRTMTADVRWKTIFTNVRNGSEV